MPAPRNKSRSLRRIYVKTPGGKTTVHYKEKKPKLGKCGKCGAKLKGVARITRNIPKSKKKPERPYGGNLCSRCMRALFVEKAKSL